MRIKCILYCVPSAMDYTYSYQVRRYEIRVLVASTFYFQFTFFFKDISSVIGVRRKWKNVWRRSFTFKSMTMSKCRGKILNLKPNPKVS